MSRAGTFVAPWATTAAPCNTAAGPTMLQPAATGSSGLDEPTFPPVQGRIPGLPRRLEKAMVASAREAARAISRIEDARKPERIMKTQSHYEVIVIGAGVAGIYQIKRLADLGVDAADLEAAPDLGGT